MSEKASFRSICLRVLFLFTALCLLSMPAHAANFAISDLSDSGNVGTLRHAIDNAANGDTITFAPDLTATINITSTLPELNSVTFVNAANVTLARTTGTDTAMDSVLRIANGATVGGTLPSTSHILTVEGDMACGISSGGSLTLSSPLSGTLTSKSVNGSWGVVAGNNISLNDISGSFSIITTNSGTAHGIHAASGAGSISLNDLLGDIIINGAKAGYGLKAPTDISMRDIIGTVDITAGSEAYGLNSGGTMSLRNISGTVSAKTESTSRACGLYSNGNLSLNSILGTVSAESNADAYAVRAHGTLDNGAAAASAISGSVTAKGADMVAAIYASGSAKLNITGIVSATSSAGTAYAIYARDANDTVTLGNGADVTGKIELNGGTNDLTMDGAGTLNGSVNNITTLIKSNAGIWNTSGTISTGDMNIQAGVLGVEILQTDSPSVNASGTITNNGEVRFSTEGSVAPGTHTILSATTLAVGGTYTLTNNSMLMSLNRNANSITLTKDAYADVASGTSGNAQAMAVALDSNSGGATGDFATILQELDSSSSAEDLGECVTQLTGFTVENMSGMSADTARMFSTAAQTRMAEVRTYQTMMADKGEPDPDDPESWPMVASNGDLAGIMHRRPDFKPNGVHLRVLGRSGDMDSHGGYSGYDYRTFAVSGGYDRMLKDGFLMGVFGGYAQTNADYKDTASSESELESYTLGMYATWFKDNWYVDTTLSRAYNKYDITRPIPFLGRTATSDPTGSTVSFKTSAGQRYVVGDYGLTPTASLEYTVFYQDAYTENGAGAANLSVDAIDSKFFESGIGGKIDRSWDTGFGRIIPEISAMWMHEWLTQSRTLSVNMTGMPGTVMPQTTAKAANDALRFGAGLRAIHDDGLSMTLRYQGEVEEHASSHSLMAEAQVLF